MGAKNKVVEKTAIEEMAERIEALENESAGNSRLIAKIRQEASDAAMEASRAVAFTKAIDQQSIVEMQARHRDLSRMIQLLITKITVVTEVGFQARQQDNGLSDKQRVSVLAAAIFAMDQPEVWWEGNSALSVSSWAKKCLDEHRAFMLATIQ